MIIINIWITFFIIFFIGNIIFVSKYKHLLIVLLSLEFIVLRIFFFLLIQLSVYYNEIYLLILFLVFRVCEGVLGLRILVSIIRTHGNDYFISFSLL